VVGDKSGPGCSKDGAVGLGEGARLRMVALAIIQQGDHGAGVLGAKLERLDFEINGDDQEVTSHGDTFGSARDC
jgi:hypothetical protein